jgi:hypothetical protein
MSEEMRMWVEVIFNVGYLIAVWGLVVVMRRRLSDVDPQSYRVANLFIWAFGLLALGDTGHVGFRVLAYAMGDLETTVSVFGLQVGLVGLGALSTAITVTLFYVVMLLIWQRRYEKPLGWFGALLILAAAVRLILMVFPQNQWNNTVPPQPWSLYRNLPLVIQGLGVAALILRDALEAGDRAFKWIGIMILASYAFYAPVILFVQEVPAIGMLMIPKTLAYVAIAWIAYVELFKADALRRLTIDPERYAS